MVGDSGVFIKDAKLNSVHDAGRAAMREFIYINQLIISV
jgi:hypothetical protein